MVVVVKAREAGVGEEKNKRITRRAPEEKSLRTVSILRRSVGARMLLMTTLTMISRYKNKRKKLSFKNLNKLKNTWKLITGKTELYTMIGFYKMSKNREKKNKEILKM